MRLQSAGAKDASRSGSYSPLSVSYTHLDVYKRQMLDSVEDYWDIAHIMILGQFAATKRNHIDAEGEKSLEELFFEITEGEGAVQ